MKIYDSGVSKLHQCVAFCFPFGRTIKLAEINDGNRV